MQVTVHPVWVISTEELNCDGVLGICEKSSNGYQLGYYFNRYFLDQRKFKAGTGKDEHLK